MTRPALNRLMHAREVIASAAAMRRIDGGTEDQAGQVLRAELMAIAEGCLTAITQYDLECGARRKDG